MPKSRHLPRVQTGCLDLRSFLRFHEAASNGANRLTERALASQFNDHDDCRLSLSNHRGSQPYAYQLRLIISNPVPGG